MSKKRYTSIDEIATTHRNFVEAADAMGSKEGLFSLLTDLYPDTAHFIVELLQNAEDMDATVVRFTLYEDCLDFEHNGTKRNFNLDDIDAITNIGANPIKKDDPTSIGKFGIGFKAVFDYTSTPEIHSGEYHFKIVEMLIPELDGVDKLSTKDSDGHDITKFRFPFNNPEKPKQQAFREVLDGLNDLDGSYILFLRHIRKIEYMLPDASLGVIEYAEDDNHHLTIKCTKPTGKVTERSHWLRFQRSFEMKDDKGYLKKLPIAVAYALEPDNKSKTKYKIVPAPGGGRTFIYFPAEKETSKLRFHINAPFASTVARDGVRECNENDILIEKIAELVVASLEEIKALGYLDVSFFAVLPNNKDNLSGFYQTILAHVIEAFEDNEYLPTREGTYTTSDVAVTGLNEMYLLFNDELVSQLYGEKKVWIRSVLANSLPDLFLQSLEIDTFSNEFFARLFKDKLPVLEQIVSVQNIEWLKRFYTACYELYDNHSYILNPPNTYSSSNVLLSALKLARIVRSSGGAMMSSTCMYYLEPHETVLDDTYPLVDAEFLSVPEKKRNRYDETARNFLVNTLGIRHHSRKYVIQDLIRQLEECSEVDESYYANSLKIAQYWNETRSTQRNNTYPYYYFMRDDERPIDFTECQIFLSRGDKPNSFSCTTASRLVLGPPYRDEVWGDIAKATGHKVLAKEYRDHYSKKELNLFVQFVEACGIIFTLKVERSPVDEHPQYYEKLYSYSGNHTGKGIEVDYSIMGKGLKNLLELQSFKISSLIWEAITYKNLDEFSDCCKAKFQMNAHAPTKSIDSSLIYWLKSKPWIPDKEGGLHKPCDILPRDMSPQFSYNPNNPIHRALGIGSSAAEKAHEAEQAFQYAEKTGQIMMSKERVRELEEKEEAYDRLMNPKAKDIEHRTVKQQLNSQSRVQEAKPSASSDEFSRDTKEQGTSIEQTIKGAKNMKPLVRKLFSRVVGTSKQERKALRCWYHGQCQMCGTIIRKYSSDPHFEAINVISTQELPASLLKTMGSGWNSMCLCPNCAAKYKYCSKDMSTLYDQIMDTHVEHVSSKSVVLTIELEGKEQKIHYKPEHFIILQSALRAIEQNEG